MCRARSPPVDVVWWFGEGWQIKCPPRPLPITLMLLYIARRKQTLTHCNAVLSIGRPGTRKGPDKLDLPRFSGNKFRSLSAKGACRSAPNARNEFKSAPACLNESFTSLT
ncbi:hypothetical protein TNCV_3976281 [Trichonephila clavipes]|nr:hypothetical protein TNCV_3976281 [Trichonephila clavipes]